MRLLLLLLLLQVNVYVVRASLEPAAGAGFLLLRPARATPAGALSLQRPLCYNHQVLQEPAAARSRATKLPQGVGSTIGGLLVKNLAPSPASAGDTSRAAVFLGGAAALAACKRSGRGGHRRGGNSRVTCYQQMPAGSADEAQPRPVPEHETTETVPSSGRAPVVKEKCAIPTTAYLIAIDIGGLSHKLSVFKVADGQVEREILSKETRFRWRHQPQNGEGYEQDVLELWRKEVEREDGEERSPSWSRRLSEMSEAVESFEKSIALVAELVQEGRDALEKELSRCNHPASAGAHHVQIPEVIVRARGTGVLRGDTLQSWAAVYGDRLLEQAGVDDFEVVSQAEEARLGYQSFLLRRTLFYNYAQTGLEGIPAPPMLHIGPHSMHVVAQPHEEQEAAAGGSGTPSSGGNGVHLLDRGTQEVHARLLEMSLSTLSEREPRGQDSDSGDTETNVLDDDYIGSQQEKLPSNDDMDSTPSGKAVSRSSSTPIPSSIFDFVPSNPSANDPNPVSVPRVDNLIMFVMAWLLKNAPQLADPTFCHLALATGDYDKSAMARSREDCWLPVVVAVSGDQSPFHVASLMLGPKFTAAEIYHALVNRVAGHRSTFLSSVIFKGEVKDPRQVVAKLVLLYSLMMSWGIDEIVWEPLRSGITLGMAQDLAAEQLREKDENGDSCAQELGRAT